VEQDLSSRLIQQFKDLREQEHDLLKSMKGLCFGKESYLQKERPKGKQSAMVA
jgi:hypothetical protein